MTPPPGIGVATRLQWLALALLAVGLPGLQPALLLSWLVVGLTLLAALKLLEARRPAERRLVALLQLVCSGLLAALQPDLAPGLLQLLVVLLALASLLALESGAISSWRLLLRRSLQVLAAALPMALALFLLLPRLQPFAPVAGLGGGMAVSGLSANLAPGAIAALVSSDAAAARLSFGAAPPPPAGERYWRVLSHEHFDGEGWTSSSETAPTGRPVRLPAAGAGPIRELWLTEASPLAAVPWSGLGTAGSAELSLSREGVLRHRGPRAQRRLYAITAADTATAASGPGLRAPDWRRSPPGAEALQLPRGRNPRLEALAATWRRQGPATARLAAAERWFRSQPFRYSRMPGSLPQVAPLDAFLFERRLGFCGHYASAFTALMRAADVPARVVSGYRGGSLVRPLSGQAYLDLRQSDAHAWSEVWLEGEGWRRVDPSGWISGAGGSGDDRQRPGAATWLVRQWWGLDLAWGRWWLGFDRGRQEALLSRLLGGRRELLGVLVIGALALGLGGGLALLRWLAHPPQGDAPRREIERCLRLLARHGLSPAAGETLLRFSTRLGEEDAALGAAVAALVAPYERWRYGAGPRPRAAAAPVAAVLRRARRRLRGELQRRRRPARRPAV